MSQKIKEKIPVSAIICEFDPLHLGHEHILQAARLPGGAVCCVMSGNFLQRGAPAILDKWTRARLALACGADLVAELPLSFACAGAERFAAGGIAIAKALGADRLFFGSEIPDPALLSRLAQALVSKDFSDALAQQPPGLGFAARRQLAVEALLGKDLAGILALPNANLGVEYIKAINLQTAKIQPCPIPRQGSGHHQFIDPKEGFLSGSQIRDILRFGGELEGLVPQKTLELITLAKRQGRCPASLHPLERTILFRLRTMSLDQLKRLPDVSEGLENRLFKAARQAGSLDELYSLVKSRRYSHARVRRLAMSALLEIFAPLPKSPPYLRILGLTELGGICLGQRDKSIPLVARPKDLGKLPPIAKETFETEARADDVYALACPNVQPAGQDYTRRLIRPPF